MFIVVATSIYCFHYLAHLTRNSVHSPCTLSWVLLLAGPNAFHICSILHAMYLLPIFDAAPLPQTLNYMATLDSFRGFHLNKYIDYPVPMSILGFPLLYPTRSVKHLGSFIIFQM